MRRLIIDELSYSKINTKYRSTEPKELRNMYIPCIRKYINCASYCNNVDFNVDNINTAITDIEVTLR